MARASSVVIFLVAAAGSFGAGWLVRDVAAPGAMDAAPPAVAPPEPGRPEAPGPSPVRPPEDALPRGDASVPPAAARRERPHDDGTLSEARAGRAEAAPIRTVADFRHAIETAWDAAHPNDPRPTDDEFLAAAQDARDRTESYLAAAAKQAESRVAEQQRILADVVRLRLARGAAGYGPAVIELRARGRDRVAGADMPGRLTDAAFDPFAPWQRDDEGVGAIGALPPRGARFVLERIEIEARPGISVGDDGDVRVGWGRNWSVRGTSNRVRLTMTGAAVVELSQLDLDVNDSAARVRFVGRFVPAGTAAEERPFVAHPEDCEGFLRDGVPVRIQIAAGHGGGNPRSVDLAGRGCGYFDRSAGAPVWNEATAPDAIRDSTWWSEGTGLVPPAKVYCVHRIDWRVRLRTGESHSTFDIEARGEKAPLAQAAPPKDRSIDPRVTPAVAFSGTWTGRLLIRPGEEDRLAFACHYFGMADVTVSGTLQDEAR